MQNLAGRRNGLQTLLTCITGSVDAQLLLRNEYLVTANYLMRRQIKGRVQLTDTDRTTLAEIGKQLGQQALEAVATIVKSNTILGWYRQRVAQKFDGSKQRKTLGRPRIDAALEALAAAPQLALPEAA